MEANLDQKLADMCHDTLFQVFLYAQKAYNSLDRGRCINIMKGYVLGTKL